MDAINIPGAAEVRDRLARLSYAQMRALAAASGVPFTTLWKVRTGETKNPGVETVRQFWPSIPAPSACELIGAEGAPAVPAEAEVRDAA